MNEDKEYVPLTHEELVQEVYRLVSQLTREEQRAIKEKIEHKAAGAA